MIKNLSYPVICHLVEQHRSPFVLILCEKIPWVLNTVNCGQLMHYHYRARLSSKFPGHISPVLKNKWTKNIYKIIAIVRSLEAAQFIDWLTDNKNKTWFNNNNSQGLKNCIRTAPASIHGLKKPHRPRCGNREEKPQPRGWCCPTCWARSYQIPNDFETDSKDWKLSLT